MNILKIGYHYAGSVDSVVFKRHECEWLLPQAVAMKLKYNPNHVPAVIYDCYTIGHNGGTYVQIYEYSCSRFDYNRRVYSLYRDNGSQEASWTLPPF